MIDASYSTTSAEFLANLPEKTKEDHEHDLQEMKKVSEKIKDINLNPKIDLEEAIEETKKLLKKFYN
jgi:hypothetical protein